MDKIRCNPMNLSYAFQEVKDGKNFKVAREAADPTLISFKDHYYLFPSVSGGFWVSDDLADWTFVETPDWPIYDYAPDVREVNGALYFSASGFQKGAIYRTADPIREPLEEVSRPFKMWDPNIFQDDD
ncbi:MAG: 1,4-beta-xylanase, partial [Clostridia bacterium]|nr:1,4-beta-xylanase [Clostridia bacterium]